MINRTVVLSFSGGKDNSEFFEHTSVCFKKKLNNV